MSARNSFSSFLLALCVRTLPSVCSFFQLIGGPHDRDQIAFENGIEKVIPAVPLGVEFVFRISRYVDLAPELPLDSPQRGEELLHTHRANNQQIDVALRVLLTSGNRAVDRGPRDLVPKSIELGLQQRNHPCRFRKQVAEFREDGGSSFCSVVGSTAFLPPLQDAACSESFKFPLKARRRSL